MAFYNHNPVEIVCDSGATASLIKHACAIKCKMPINPTTHVASQADGKSRLNAVGEVHIVLSRGTFKLRLDAIVVSDLDCDVLAGMPFMKSNNLSLDIPKDQIKLGHTTISYATPHNHGDPTFQSSVLRATCREIVFPGDYLEIPTPENIPDNTEIAYEPRCDSRNPEWPLPGTTHAIDGEIRILYDTGDAVVISKHQHVAQVVGLS